jgi:hypothetical protein
VLCVDRVCHIWWSVLLSIGVGVFVERCGSVLDTVVCE